MSFMYCESDEWKEEYNKNAETINKFVESNFRKLVFENFLWFSTQIMVPALVIQEGLRDFSLLSVNLTLAWNMST